MHPLVLPYSIGCHLHSLLSANVLAESWKAFLQWGSWWCWKLYDHKSPCDLTRLACRGLPFIAADTWILVRANYLTCDLWSAKPSWNRQPLVSCPRPQAWDSMEHKETEPSLQSCNDWCKALKFGWFITWQKHAWLFYIYSYKLWRWLSFTFHKKMCWLYQWEKQIAEWSGMSFWF